MLYHNMLCHITSGYYLGARDAPLGVRFLRNFSLGVWKFGQLPIDVIQIVGLGV